MKYIEIVADEKRNLICGDYKVFAGEQFNCAFAIKDNFSGENRPDYYILKFETAPFGKKFSSGRINGESSPAAVRDGIICCPLTGDMTAAGRLKIQLEAHSLDGSGNEIIEKTGIATLDFGSSLDDGADFAGGNTSLSAEVEKLERRITALEKTKAPADPGYISVVCAAELLYIDDIQTPLIYADSREEAEEIIGEMTAGFDYENCRYIIAAVPPHGISGACLITVKNGKDGFEMNRYMGKELLALLKEID